MINIIRLGSVLPDKDRNIKHLMRFSCYECRCEFEADEDDYQYDEEVDWYIARCPCCGHKLHEWSK